MLSIIVGVKVRNLSLLAVALFLCGLLLFFGLQNEPNSQSVNKVPAKPEHASTSDDAHLVQTAPTQSKTQAALLSSVQANTAKSSTLSTDHPLSNEPSQIEKLVAGARLIDEAILEMPSQRRLVQLYDVGDRLKYPLIALESYSEGGQAVQHVSVADHSLVKIDPQESTEAFEARIASIGWTIRKEMNTPGHYLVAKAVNSIASIESWAAMAVELEQATLVNEKDYIVFHQATTPTDNYWLSLWGLHNTGQSGGLSDADIDAPEAWDIFTGSQNVVVGVIDTGVDYNHPDLINNRWINPGEIANDGIDNDNNGFVDDVYGWDFANDDNNPMDDDGHGTHCAGTIGAQGNNNQGVIGVNWAVKLAAIKFLGPYGGTTSDAIDSIHYAVTNQMTLTSNSWGGGSYSSLLKQAIESARDADQLFIAAAGNGNYDNDQTPFYPASYDVDNVIAVAATDRHDQLSYFSQWGLNSVDIAAPGSSIFSTTPNNKYATYSGTSMATPHVAGACALYLGALPSSDYQKVKTMLLDSVDPIPPLQDKVLSGGRLNIYTLLQSSLGPHIVVESLSLSGNHADPTLFSPGELVEIQPQFVNSGNQIATQVSAQLSTTDPAVSISHAQLSLGDLAPGVTANEKSFFLSLAPGSQTPKTVSFILDIESAEDVSWTHSFDILFESETSISGHVFSADNGSGVAGAKIIYSGPTSGSVTTDASGAYAFTTIDGTYDFYVQHPNYTKSASKSLTTPPSHSGQDFHIGQAIMKVRQTPLYFLLKERKSATRRFKITNRGNMPLNYEVVSWNPEWVANGLWHPSNHRVHSGSSSWYYGQSDSRNYDTGERNKGSLTSSPIWIPADGGHFAYHEFLETENNPNYDIARLEIKTSDTNTWHLLRKSSDVAQFSQANISLDDYSNQWVQLRFNFDTVDYVHNNYEGWYVDDFLLDQLPSNTVQIQNTDGTLNSGAYTYVELTIDSKDLAIGHYTQNIVVTSNDPKRPQQVIPISIYVVPNPQLKASHKVLKSLLYPGEIYSKLIQLKNNRSEPINWTITSLQSDIFEVKSVASGQLEQGEQTKIEIALKATNLDERFHTETLYIHTHSATGSGHIAIPILVRIHQNQNFINFLSSNSEIASMHRASPMLPASSMGYNADPDQDGHVNLVEYALGGDPKVANTTPLTAVMNFTPISMAIMGMDSTFPQSQEQVAFSFSRRTDDPSLVYTVYESEDLSTWQELDLANAIIQNANDPNYERVHCPLDDSKRNSFYKVEVSIE
jgi:subtilisin family serine protease